MNITRVELYLNECYGCKSAKFIPLHDWFLTLKLPLDRFQSCRVPLKQEWQDFAKTMKETANIDLPFVAIHTDGEVMTYVYEYDNFIKQIERNKMLNKHDFDQMKRNIFVKQAKDDAVETVEIKKKQTKKKQSVVKKNKTATTEVK